MRTIVQPAGDRRNRDSTLEDTRRVQFERAARGVPPIAPAPNGRPLSINPWILFM